MFNSAVIGLGNISRVHVSAIKSFDNARLAAVCDTNPAKKEQLPEGAAFYTDVDELLRKEKIDIAHICLPHYLHYPVAKKVAEAGVNIFAEKPLAMNAKEGEEYCKLEKANKVKICLCFQNRLNTTNEMLYDIIQKKKYGKVIGIRGSVAWYRSKEYYEAGPWRALMDEAGGGCMINQAIHTMDLIQYFAGSPLVSAKGTMGQILDYGIEVEDTAAGHFIFENGVRGLFIASVANFADENVEMSIRCEEADFILRDKKLIKRKDGEEEVIAEDSKAFAGKQVYGSSHVKLIERFYQAVKTGSDDYIHPEEGIPSLKMIDAILESSKSGKTIKFN